VFHVGVLLNPARCNFENKSTPTQKTKTMKLKIRTNPIRLLTSMLALAVGLAVPSAVRAAVTISTTNGLGADTYLSNDGQTGQGPTTTHGLETGFQHRVFSGTRMKFLYVRFDKGTSLINYAGSTVSINFSGANRTRTCSVYGLKNGDIGEAWGESTVCYSNAPGIAWTNGTPLAQFPTIDTNRMVLLGTMPNFNAATGVQTSDPNSLNLQSFLEADTDGLVTFLFLTTSDSSQSYFGYTKEATNTSGVLLGFEPTLNMPNAVVDPGLSNLVWSAGNGAWDFAAPNWNDGVANVAYQEVNTIGNRVQFDDSSSGASPVTISLDATVTPRSITNSSAKDYVITGAGGGSIMGGTGITKSGNGTLTLSNINNGFVGNVQVSGGTLAFGPGALGGASARINIDAATLKYVGANADDLSLHVVTFGPGGATIDTGGNTVSMTLPIGGTTAGGLTKAGDGGFYLSGAHTYTGDTVVNGGTLGLNTLTTIASTNIIVNGGATLDTLGLGSLVLNGTIGQKVSGSGTNSGGLTITNGTTLSPGDSGGTGAGTFTIAGDLTVSGGTNVFDISTNAGASDQLVIQGSVFINSGRVRLVPGTVLTNGIYTLVQYGGVISGAASTMLIDGFSQPGQVAILDDSVAGKINLIVADLSSANLTWTGDGSANLWNVGSALTWNNGSGASVFNYGDLVTFNNTGSANPNVNISQAVIPSSITVDATTDYTFNDSTGLGGGKISGSTGLTKNNTGKLTVLTVNNNGGTTTVNGGTVQVGNGGVDGHLGLGSITNNGQLIFQQTVNHTVNGITGSGSLSQIGATTLSVPGNTSYSGSTTIGSGATLVLGNGGALTLTTSGVTNDGTLVLDTSAAQTLATPFTGAGGFTKRGTGALAINAAPGYTGTTAIEGGTTTLGAANVIPGGLRVETGATVNLNGFDQTVTSLASVNFAGGVLVNNAANVTNTITVDNATDSDSSIAINNGATGVIALRKKGAGSLLLRGNSTYSGGTIVEAGTLDYRDVVTVLGSGGVVLSNATIINFGGNGVHPVNTFLVAAGGTVNVNSAALGNGTSGTWSSGDSASVLNIVGPMSWESSTVKQFQNFTGKVLVDAAGTLRFSSTGLSTNGGDPTLFEVNGTLQTRNGTGNNAGSGVSLGALTGSGFISGPQAPPGNSTYIIGLQGANATFSGSVLGDVPGSANTIVKAGAGTQTFTGTNIAYAGSTIVSNGILAFVGADATPTNTVVVNATAPGVLDVSGLPGGTLVLGLTTNNQTLSGNGTITGSVVVDTSGGNVVTVAPGNSTGVLTISGSLTLSASSVVRMELNRTNVALNADELVTSSLVANGATLIVTNIGPTLIAGTKFQLFNSAVTGFGTVNLPTSDASGQIAYSWQNDLATDGSITLLTGVNPVPVNMTSTVTGGGTTLDLSWPTDRTGWQLQVQTNSLSVGISTNWAPVAGSTLTNYVVVPVVRTNPTVFYRLTLPLP
jgi:fibronectin-binding autotransporter adhesin